MRPLVHRARDLRARAAELLIEAERLERHAARPTKVLGGEMDPFVLIELISRQHTFHLAFSSSVVGRQPGENPLPRGEA